MNNNFPAKILFFFLLILTGPAFAVTPALKQPQAAGSFYPADPKELARQISSLMQSADIPAQGDVQMAIAPHAGYEFSGPVAAYTYKALAHNKYNTIIVMGPSHFYPFEGAAIWPAGGFQTPLGTLPVDEDFAKHLIQEDPDVKALPNVFQGEHAVEVELPFVQRVFGSGVKIVPLLLGQPNIQMCEHLAQALNKLIAERKDVLVLISSDMSHYQAYGADNQEDARTLDALKAEDIAGFWNGNLGREMEMCGFVPVTVGLMLAKLRGWSQVDVLKHANSGDTSGDKSRVVGYGAVLFYKPPQLNEQQKNDLLKLARQTIETYVRTGRKINPDSQDKRLYLTQGAFVTIVKNGQLRGCIGNIIGQEPLVDTVRDMAIAAASQDPRFAPVKTTELKDLKVEISVLSPPHMISSASQITLGRDGVIAGDGHGHQGVFLPQVASETGWSKDRFLSELCSQKAGLDADCWKSPDVKLYTFTAEVFGEK